MKSVSFLLFLTFLLASVVSADTIIYNSIPNPQEPGAALGLDYGTTGTAGFGPLVQFAGTARELTKVTIELDNPVYESIANEPVGTSSGFNVPVTVGVYDVGPGNTVGSQIGSQTENLLIPWRPEPSAVCGGSKYQAIDSKCYDSATSTWLFDFTGTTVPDQAIFQIAWNTDRAGYNPTGVAGPLDFLRLGLTNASPSVGADPLPDTAYWNTSIGAFYHDGGAGGTGTFRQDTGWDGVTAALKVEATDATTAPVPEPSSYLMLGTALLGIVALAHKQRKLRKQT